MYAANAVDELVGLDWLTSLAATADFELHVCAESAPAGWTDTRGRSVGGVDQKVARFLFPPGPTTSTLVCGPAAVATALEALFEEMYGFHTGLSRYC